MVIVCVQAIVCYLAADDLGHFPAGQAAEDSAFAGIFAVREDIRVVFEIRDSLQVGGHGFDAALRVAFDDVAGYIQALEVIVKVDGNLLQAARRDVIRIAGQVVCPHFHMNINIP